MKARFVVEYGKSPDQWPVVVGMEEDVDEIFELPQENSVGMMDYDAIVQLEFEGSNIRRDALIRGTEGVGGSGLYSHCPVFDKEWIAYGQTRGFSLFNVATRQFVDHIPYPELGMRITAVSAIPNLPFTFIIQIDKANHPTSDRALKVLQFDLKGNFTTLAELLQVGRHPGERGEPLIIRDNCLFGEHDGVFETFDLKTLKPTQHPLTSFLNNLSKDNVSFHMVNGIAIHPKFPFAIVTELLPDYSSRIWMVRWENADPEKRIVEVAVQYLSMFSEVKDPSYFGFEFSPDGAWMIFGDGSDRTGPPYYIAMPVDPNDEFYLGKPKMLGKVMRENAQPVSSAWISKPLSYVVSDGKVLYKWELEKLR